MSSDKLRILVLGPHKYGSVNTHAHTHACTHADTHIHTGKLVYSNTASSSPLTVARGPRGLHTLITQLTWSKTPGKALQYLITPSQTQARMTFTPPVSLSVWLKIWPYELSRPLTVWRTMREMTGSYWILICQVLI